MATRSPTEHHPYWGSVATPALLPNILGSPTQSSTLEVGDVACVDPGGGQAEMYLCVTATLGAAVWTPLSLGSSAAPTTRGYGSTTVIFGNNTSFPTSGANLEVVADQSGGHLELVRDFDSFYNLCQVRIRIVDGTGVLSDVTQQFASRVDLVAYLNTNVPNAAGTFTAYAYMEVFDQVDGRIAAPPKVYGKNRFWAGLTNRAPGRYHNPGTGSCFFGSLSGSAAAVLTRATTLNAIWQLLFPANPMPAPASWTGNEFGCFFINRNRYRRFDMPPFSSILSVPPSLDRFVRQAGSTIVFAGAALSYDLSAGDEVAYGALSTSGLIGNGFGSFEAFSELQEHLLEGQSVVVGYPLIHGTRRGVLIKPIGHDQWYFDYFDDTAFRLEAIGVNRENWRNKLRPITGLTQNFDQRSSGPIDATSFRDTFGATLRQQLGAIPGQHGYRTQRVRFQYRDLATNRVSALTQAGVETIVRRRARPFAMMTRNRLQ